VSAKRMAAGEKLEVKGGGAGGGHWAEVAEGGEDSRGECEG